LESDIFFFKGHWKNEDDLKEIAERCQRIALIMKRTADRQPEAGEEQGDVLQAAARLQAYVHMLRI